VMLVCVAVMCDGGRQYSPCSSPCRRPCSNAALPVYLSTCLPVMMMMMMMMMMMRMMVVVMLVCVAVMCDGGRQYSPCSSPCRRTCSNAALPVDSYCAAAPCVEGCYCPSDTAESGTRESL